MEKITVQHVFFWVNQKIFHLRIRSLGIFTNRFRLLTIVQAIFTLCLLGLVVKSNFFHGIDASAYFTTVWSMFGSVLALLITIHFFYIQNFSNYVPLAFVFHANTSKSSYITLGIIWAFTLTFLFLGWNVGAYLNSCPDHYLFPVSILLESLGIWLVIYFFHTTSQNLSPAWITNSVERFFVKTLDFAKRSESILEKYGEMQGVNKDFRVFSKFHPWAQPLEICWFNLETLCDAVQMLINRNERSLSTWYLAVISKCFWYLLEAYWKISTIPNLEYLLTQESEIDKRLDRLFEKVENIVFVNIRGNDTYGIVESMSLLKQLTLKTSEVQYSGRLWYSEGPIFERALIRHTWLFDKLMKEKHDEWLFQWKENSFAYLRAIISKNLAVSYVESILQKLDLFVFWEIWNQKSYETHKIYVGLLLPHQSDDKFIIDVSESAREHIEWIISMRDETNTVASAWIDKIINSMIKEIWQYLIMGRASIIEKALNNGGDNLFLEELQDLIDNVNMIFQKGVEKKLPFDNFLPLLVSEFRNIGEILSQSELNQELKETYLEKLLNLISIIVGLGDEKFLSKLYSDRHVFDVLCWIGLYGLKMGNQELFEKSRKIFEKYLSDPYWKGYGLRLWVAEYYFGWIMAIKSASLGKTADSMIEFFVEKLQKNIIDEMTTNPDFTEHIRERAVILVNDIADVLAPSQRTYPIDEPSSIDYISKEFSDLFTEEKRKELMLEVLSKCQFLVEKSNQ